MKIKQTFGMDHSRCENGVWREFGDARLLIASTFSRRFQTAKRTLERLIRERQEAGTPMTTEELVAADAELYASTILLSWTGVEGDDGQPLEPTPDARAELLFECPPFLASIKRLASEFAPYSPLDDEALRKNSSPSSPGARGGDGTRSNGSATSPQTAS